MPTADSDRSCRAMKAKLRLIIYSSLRDPTHHVLHHCPLPVVLFKVISVTRGTFISFVVTALDLTGRFSCTYRLLECENERFLARNAILHAVPTLRSDPALR